MKKIALVFFLTIVATSRVISQFNSDSLIIGSIAPPIQVAKWLKGAPVKEFKEGTVYVIELTMRYCAPCRLSIPYISAISKKYSNNAVVLAVYVTENKRGSSSTTYIRNINRFLKTINDKITYRVAVDDIKQDMFLTWTKNTAMSAYPRIFIVDKNKRIAWIGGALDDRLDDIVGQVIDGSFDTGVARQHDLEMQEIEKKITIARKGEMFEVALAIIDSLLDRKSSKAFLISEKFKILLKEDELRAYTFARQLLKTHFSNTADLNEMASWIRYNAQIRAIKNPDWDLAIALSERSFKLHLKQSKKLLFGDLAVQANIYAIQGDYEEAIKKQEDVIAYLGKYNSEDTIIKKHAKLILLEYKTETVNFICGVIGVVKLI